MPPLPKKKTAKSRKLERRAHLGITTPKLVNCPECQSPKLPHHACPECGSYRGREVTETKE